MKDLAAKSSALIGIPLQVDFLLLIQQQEICKKILRKLRMTRVEFQEMHDVNNMVDDRLFISS